jgi:hypothetical protein
LLSSYFNSNINKLYVLDIAQKAGFKIPSTCVLHDKNDIANYIKTHQEVITKALSNGIYNFAVQKAYYTYTEKITLQDISNIDRELFFSLFQQQIVKKYEIRTFYFDNNCYSMAIFSQNDERTTIDFRKSTNNRQNRHIPYKLPVAIEDKIKNLMNSIGLTTGSIDTIFFEMFLNIQKQPFQMLLDNAEQQEKETIIQIKNFIIDNELGFFTDNPSLFPSLECIWDSPFMIHNSIIDIKNTPHDYDLIFKQLRELGCQHIQLRFFSLCTIPELEDLLGIIQKYSFLSIEFIIQYQIDIENDLEDFMKKHLVIRNLFVMSSPYNKKIDVNYEDISSSTLMFLKQPLNSCESCGKINMKTFIPPNIQDFFENKLFRDAKKITYNGYL